MRCVASDIRIWRRHLVPGFWVHSGGSFLRAARILLQGPIWFVVVLLGSVLYLPIFWVLCMALYRNCWVWAVIVLDCLSCSLEVF